MGAAPCKISPSGDAYVISPIDYPVIRVTTVHLSCHSSVYRGPAYNYAGFILYTHGGKSEWTLNGWRCKTGYIVVKDTNSPGVKRYEGKVEGIVHGAVYKDMFGEDVGNTVGEAFAVMNGKVKWRSATFNARNDAYHDNSREISALAQQCVAKVLQMWMEEGERSNCLCTSRNFAVKGLLH